MIFLKHSLNLCLQWPHTDIGNNFLVILLQGKLSPWIVHMFSTCLKNEEQKNEAQKNSIRYFHRLCHPGVTQVTLELHTRTTQSPFIGDPSVCHPRLTMPAGHAKIWKSHSNQISFQFSFRSPKNLIITTQFDFIIRKQQKSNCKASTNKLRNHGWWSRQQLGQSSLPTSHW